MSITGSIPEEVEVWYLEEEKIYVNDEDYLYHPENYLKLKPAMFIDPNSGHQKSSAKAWARNSGKSVRIKNEPISGIQVIKTEFGGAYKVFKCKDNNNFYFDLRDDTLMDVILNDGIVNGKLNGSYIWAKIGPSFRLIRVNSKIYNALKKIEPLKTYNRIPKKKLEEMHVYQNKSGKNFLYLGNYNFYNLRVKTPSYDSDQFSIKLEKTKESLFLLLAQSLENEIESQLEFAMNNPNRINRVFYFTDFGNFNVRQYKNIPYLCKDIGRINETITSDTVVNKIKEHFESIYSINLSEAYERYKNNKINVKRLEKEKMCFLSHVFNFTTMTKRDLTEKDDQIEKWLSLTIHI